MERGWWTGCWGLAAAAALMGGCVLSPTVDPGWGKLQPDGPDDQLVYARSRDYAVGRQAEAGRNVWIGRAVAGVGAGLVATFIALWQDVEHHHDGVFEVSRARRPYAWLGAGAGGIVVAGVGYAGYHQEMRDQWRLMEADQRLRLGELDEGGMAPPARSGPAAATPAPAKPDAAPPTVPATAPDAPHLFVATGVLVPRDCAEVPVVRVSGALDPQLADVAKVLPALRLPLLVVPGANGAPTTYHMGWTAVRKALGVR